MEEKQIAIKAPLVNRLAQMILEHSLPINLTIGSKLTYLRQVTMTYDIRDELLVEWIIYRLTEDDIYAS